MKKLIIGCNGQLGSAFRELLCSEDTIALTRNELDLASPDTVKKTLKKVHEKTPFEVILNCAAYTNVNKAEEDAELAKTVNAISVGLIAQWCKENKVLLIHFSTDYVFSGEKGSSYSETDKTNPLNSYGSTKRNGELEIIDSGCRYLIARTSWLYGVGENFIGKILDQATKKSELKVVEDQVGTPTNCTDLARCIKKLLEDHEISSIPSGIYHLTNKGSASWYEFAKEILKYGEKFNRLDNKPALLPVKSSEFPSPVKRPSFSVLDCSKFENEFNLKMPSWQDSLESYFEKNYGKN